MLDVEEYLLSKGIKPKRSINKSGDVELLMECPQCGKQKLYINTTTKVFQCFVCEAERPGSEFSKGYITTLQRYFGDIVSVSIPFNTQKFNIDLTEKVEECHKALLESKKGLRYLFIRGITNESIKRFKLGLKVENGQGYISIPCYRAGIPRLIKYRILPPIIVEKSEKYLREPNCESILFNQDVIDEYDELIIAEGEIDSISLIQAGFENVVGLTVGAGTLLPEWYDKLILKNKLRLIFDSDTAGQKAAKDVWATRLGYNKCYNVLLPEGYDVNEFLRTRSIEELRDLVNSAEKFRIQGISSFAEIVSTLAERRRITVNEDYYPLPWNSVNEILGGGFFNKRLYTLCGIPGVGKTTWAVQICDSFSRDGIPSLLFCMEMPETDLAAKVIQIRKGMPIIQVYNENIWEITKDFLNIPIYFGYRSRITADIFYNTLQECRNRYGIRFAVFDNIQRMVRTGNESDMAKASGLFKDMTMDFNMPILLVSQPRKKSEENIGRKTWQDDLKGSSALVEDADAIILMHRKKRKEEDIEKYGGATLESVTEIYIDKGRLCPGGSVKLDYQGNLAKFEIIPNNIFLRKEE